MNDVQRRLVDRVADEAYLAGLQERSIDEVRACRDECNEAEKEVSFERRLCQARIDILSAELDRRLGRNNDDLLSRLPQILADGRSNAEGLPTRAPDLSLPRNTDVPRRRVEEIVGETTLARLAQVPTDEIQKIIESLGVHERNLSSKRKRVHDVLDALEEEIVRRYSSGELDASTIFNR